MGDPPVEKLYVAFHSAPRTYEPSVVSEPSWPCASSCALMATPFGTVSCATVTGPEPLAGPASGKSSDNCRWVESRPWASDQLRSASRTSPSNPEG